MIETVSNKTTPVCHKQPKQQAHFQPKMNCNLIDQLSSSKTATSTNLFPSIRDFFAKIFQTISFFLLKCCCLSSAKKENRSGNDILPETSSLESINPSQEAPVSEENLETPPGTPLDFEGYHFMERQEFSFPKELLDQAKRQFPYNRDEELIERINHDIERWRLNREIVLERYQNPLELDPILMWIGREFPSLKEITLKQSNFTDTGFDAIRLGCPNLKCLTFDQVAISDQQIEKLVSSRPLLEKLYFTNCAIGNQSLMAIARHCTYLVTIFIKGAQVSEEAVMELARRCRNLSSCLLLETPTGDQALKELSTNSQNFLLLGMGKNTTDQGLKFLVTVHIGTLFLDGTVTIDGLKTLLPQNPNLYIPNFSSYFKENAAEYKVELLFAFPTLRLDY